MSVLQTIVSARHVFFERLRREYRLVATDSKHEWVQYGPVAWIFFNFTSTLFFGESAHVGFFPQTSLAGDTPQFADTKHAYRTPDSSGLWVSTVADVTTCWLYWWCEDKSLENTEHIDAIFQPEEGKEKDRRVYTVERIVKQLNIQALYAFLHFDLPPNGLSSHPGFFAFLTIGDYFTLFYYCKPDNLQDLMDNAESKKEFEEIPLRPEVVMFHEPILDNETGEFTLQMLYAFELLRRIMKPIYAQPSFYHPHTDVDVSSIHFRSKKPMEEQVDRVANADIHDAAEQAALMAIHTSPQSPDGDASGDYKPSRPRNRNTSGTNSPRTRSQVRAAALAAQGNPADVFTDTGSDSQTTPRPSSFRTVPEPSDDMQRLWRGRGPQVVEPGSPTPNLSMTPQDIDGEVSIMLQTTRNNLTRPRNSLQDDVLLLDGLNNITLHGQLDEQAED
ncbi:hypothetical protein BDY19DRAFT_379930 [Irpex rosettiformis]|uniref:Uncharacterized protein n=1 Tax=Irpex rosettiformis TaxID=378272 RepID=A0ACB8TW73_9APHY|nr:hypothetical protein BDY19DRAFT_379930 [Irpex rosettiformis]